LGRARAAAQAEVTVRWLYAAFVVAGLLYFPLSTGFHLQPPACELAPSLSLIVYSLHNTPHILMFAVFYVLSWVRFREAGPARYGWAGAATLIMGALVEIAEGLTGQGHCRVRDLVPDAAGVLLALVPLVAWTWLRQPRQSLSNPDGGNA